MSSVKSTGANAVTPPGPLTVGELTSLMTTWCAPSATAGVKDQLLSAAEVATCTAAAPSMLANTAVLGSPEPVKVAMLV